MRVYYSSGEYIDFPTASHWEQCGTNWVELADDNGNILAVLNWDRVWLMKPMS
jgi:hypothetical protein